MSESKGMDKGKPLTTLVKALNEFDSKVTGIDWRLKIETQRGAVIANELKNNANKLAKWTAMADARRRRANEARFRVARAPARSERARRS